MKRINPFDSLAALDNKDLQVEKKTINKEVKVNESPINTNYINFLFHKNEKEKKVIKTIYTSEKISKKLENISKEYNISVNEVINTILEKVLEN